MQTRRRVKSAAAAAADDSVSQAGGSDAPTGGTLAVDLPPDLDADVLLEHLPEFDLSAVTAEMVVSLYGLFMAHAEDLEATQRDLEAALATSERKDVELDQALQDRETATKEMEGAMDEVQAELKQLKQERDQLATSNHSLQAQLASFTNSQASSSTELENLKHKVADVEREKRDLVGVVSRLKEDSTQRDEEVTTLRSNLKQARQEYQALESQLREVRSTETSTKFKLDSLTQQLELARTESERASSELSVKSDEFAKYRRARHAEFAQLQAAHDALTQTHSASEGTLRALQTSHAAQSHQLAQALARVQDLTGQLAEREATFASEAAGLRRLVGMMEEREEQAKAMVDSIEKEWATVGERAERREEALREESERERRRAEDAEKRVDQLEAVMAKLDRGELPVPAGLASMPATPDTPFRMGTPDGLSQGLFGLSPTVALASRAQKTGKTFTEVYADYARLQDEMAKKNAEFEHMELTLSSVLAQIEEHAPLIAQQREEYDRLQSESNELATQLSQALGDRDAHSAAHQETSQKLTKATRENDLLQKQLNDLGHQVRSLLRDLSRRDDPSLPTDAELEADANSQPAENIEEVITNNLVLFRSVGSLQEQNQKLLRIVRELGAKMEAEEKEYREQLEKEQGEAVREAHEAIQELEQRLENQRKSSEATIQAYAKERDTLRTMVARAERAGVAGVTTAGLTNGDVHMSSSVDNAAAPDVQRKLNETESQFDAYRTEMNTDNVRLREDATAAQREASQLGAALAKANARVEYLNERHRMAQDQYAIQARELDGLSKRNQQLYDQYTRVDIEWNRAAEDLLAANGAIEQLRNECANLRAEKKIWAGVQNRLVEENKTLSVERSHISDLMANVQKMHNDLERSGENDRRRLESQIQMMEGQTHDLRTQLSKERDAVRHVTLQKDIELREIQTKQEKLARDLASTRESLVSAETSKKHLEERVQELNKYLQGNQEKLAVYERRPGVGDGIAHATAHDSNREQQFETEVAELRAALKVTEVDLTNAREHVKQFQEISQANEAALASLSLTHEEYRTSTEAQIAHLESNVAALQERCHALQQENVQENEKHAELQRLLEAERIAWANDKRTLEDAIVDMSTSEKHSESDRASRENEVREQVERAKAAEERYSREVVAHAESIKAVEDLRRQLGAAQEAGRSGSAAAETAQAKLAASEMSWKQQREALEKEVSDLNARCKDLAAQNSTLHHHLESVSTQAVRIRQAADASPSVGTSETDASDDAESKLSELRSVVAYLRKEKEIVDLQLDLAKQENVRVKSQIEHLAQTLDETRETLSQERERAVEASASDAQHVELMDRINQLTILRESNATLRADCEAHAKRARDLDIRLKQVTAELEPAKEQARVAQAELEARDAQIQRLERESTTWQERNRQLLSKYDRIDPAEVQALKDEIEQLKAEKAAAQGSLEAKDDDMSVKEQRIETLEGALRQHKESYAKNMQNFRQRLGVVNGEKAQALAERDEIREQLKVAAAERDTLRAQLQGGPSSAVVNTLTQQVEALTHEKSVLEQSLAEAKAVDLTSTPSEQTAELEQTIVALRAERDGLLAEKVTWMTVTTPAAAEGAGEQVIDQLRGQWEAERSQLAKAKEEALAQAEAADTQRQKTMEELKGVKFSNEKLQAKLVEIHKARNADATRAREQQEVAVTAAIEKVKGETGPSAIPSADDAAHRFAEELKALEARLTEKHQQELQAARAAAAANPTSSDLPDIAAAVAAREEELKKAHAEDIEAAVERGRSEGNAKLRVKEQQHQRLAAKLKATEAENMELRKKAGVTPGQPSAPAPTPAPTVEAGAGTSAAGKAAAKIKVPPAKAPTAGGSAAGVKAPSGLPRKPSLGGAAPAAGASAPQAGAAGAGRGGRGRGGAPAARALTLRGAAAAAAGAANGSAAGSSAGGVSIMGAASKRGREEGEGDDSLAKRLKPAEGAAPKPPVQLRRNPPPA